MDKNADLMTAMCFRDNLGSVESTFCMLKYPVQFSQILLIGLLLGLEIFRKSSLTSWGEKWII